MKKILVTGGAGFIGSNFIRYFLNEHAGYKVINLDKLTYAGNRNNLKDIERDPRYTFIKGDICDKRVVERAIEGCDAVINYAAESHVDRSIKRADEFLRTNIDGVQVLLDAVNKFKVPKIIQVSTDEVYGSIKRGSFKEKDRLNPSSPYAASKAAADLLCMAYHTTYKTPVVITRTTNNFGEYQYPEKVIPLFVTNALDNRHLPLYADGMNRRDWIYVLDNCEAIDCALEAGRIGEVYNIGSGNEKTNLDLTRTILKMMEKSDKLIRFVKDRPGHDKRYSLNSSKIKALGWRPRYSFDKAIEATVRWYKTNTWWWRPLKKA